MVASSDCFFRYCEEPSDEAIQLFLFMSKLDCFAALAMTVSNFLQFRA